MCRNCGPVFPGWSRVSGSASCLSWARVGRDTGGGEVKPLLWPGPAGRGGRRKKVGIKRVVCGGSLWFLGRGGGGQPGGDRGGWAVFERPPPLARGAGAAPPASAQIDRH